MDRSDSSTAIQSARHHLLPLRNTNSEGVRTKTMRNSPSMRGFNRTTQYPNTQGSDRSERPVSSFAREGREEGSAVEGDGSFVPGGGSFRAVGGGQRRIASEIASSHSENITDRNQTSYTRDPLWRSQDTNLSDTPRLTERSGHGPLVYRDPTAVVTAGGGVSRVVPSFDRERSFGPRVGDEDFPIEVQGRYERMRVLGRGSFGAVTLVKDSRDSKLYAMKTLNVGEKPEERVAAVEEVRLLRKLKHPSLLSLFDTFLSADGRLLCLTTTYCESGDLAKVVKHAAKSKLPLGEKIILGWFAQLCMGVHHLHEEKRVIHRDIKPNNVFLMDSKKIIQLGDFGLAKVINDNDKEVKTEVGTPYYTSPEMCNNQPYGFPSDVWSLGIVLFELLTLDVPFRSKDVVALVSQVTKAPPPPLPDTYTGEIISLARWMLQKDPIRRPTLTQALACQPLRRHMISFVKSYRPMNTAERQRRQDIKDLEAQVASIADRGGEDPQIPSDVEEGCGTFPIGTEDETERHGTTGGKGEGTVEWGGLGQIAAVVAIKVKSPILAGKTREGLLDASRAEAGEAKGVCNRCGAKGACTCAGGDNARSGLSVGIGNITLGRSFGSPQQSKGTRNIMSWNTRRAIAVDDDRDGGSDGDRDHGLSGSDGENCRNNGGSGSREHRKTAEGDNSEGREGVRGGGAGGNDECTPGNRKRITSQEMGVISTLDGENGDKAMDSGRKAKTDSEGRVDLPASQKVSLPLSTSSPGPPQSSARLKHASGDSSNEGECCNPDKNLHGEEQHPITVLKSEHNLSLSEQTDRHRSNDGSGEERPVQSTGILDGIQADDRDTVANSEQEALVHITRRKATQQEEESGPSIPTSAEGGTTTMGGIWSSTAADKTTTDSIANITGDTSEAKRNKTQNDPGNTSTQVSRSPRLSGTLKTTKRLSEALTYAADDLRR